ncbi:MAG: AbrB/MazE/SpoVT family DNA-binding domain-containing protein [Gammaproteobacteria bacterium]|nr:AbrB/MazE/SpoVT family DNA-binding domain-containing protein [Gammaproteobacteria bacterium]
MHEIIMGEKGQVTIPKAIRDHYNLAKGDQVRMIDLGNGIMEVILLRHSKDLPPPTIKAERKASPDNMKNAAKRAAGTRYRRAAKK